MDKVNPGVKYSEAEGLFERALTTNASGKHVQVIVIPLAGRGWPMRV